MPYNPGIQDQSAQYLSAGLNQAGDSFAQGIREYAKNKQADAVATGQIEAYLKQTGGQLSGGSQKLVEKLMNGKATLSDKMGLLGQLQTETAIKTQQQQQQAQQLALQQAQAKAQALQRLQQLAQYSGGVGGGVLAPQVQARLQAQLKNPSMVRAAQIAQATGEAPGADSMLAADSREEIAGLKSELAGLKANKPSVVEQTLPSGAKVAVSPGTGGFSVLPQTAEQQAKVEGAKVEAEMNNKSASNLLNDITDVAESSRHTLGSVDRILSLYNQGAQSGFGQSLLTQGKAALGRFGLGKTGLANQQQFEQELDSLALTLRRELMKGTGGVSDYETKSVEKALASPDRSPEANKQIIGVMRNIAQRAIKLDELRSSLEDQKVPMTDISRAIRKMRDTMPVGVDSLDDLPTAAKPAGPSLEDRLKKYK